MSEWQPIATAPKEPDENGYRPWILIWDPAFERPHVAYWFNPGWYDGNYILEEEHVTHWMPLPEAPKETP